jgi:hypothetical protein
MIQGPNSSRRCLLCWLVYLGSFAFIQSIWPLYTTRKTNDLAGKLANFYVDRKSAKLVGLEYLRTVPSEGKLSLLVDLICSFDEAQRGEFAQADKHQLKELLLLRQRDDFEHERVVNVRGWILSKTECRLCALAALI